MMQSTRSAVVFGVILLALAGIFAPASHAATVSSFTTVPGPGGDVTLTFTAINGTGSITVDVFRMFSSVKPIASQFTSGTLVADDVAVTNNNPKVMVNTAEETTNQGQGFEPVTVTVSAGLFWYMLKVTDSLGTNNSSIQGAVADVNPPATMSAGKVDISCTDATSEIEIAFENPMDEVVDATANLTLNPGSVKQHALPAADYTFDFLLFRSAQSEVFDVVNDANVGMEIATQEIVPYNRGAITTYIDYPTAGTAYAYAIRLVDTVGNVNGGSPLSQNQADRIVIPPDNVAVTEALVAGVATNIVTFTVNTASLVSDPDDTSPAYIKIYATTGGVPITSANLSSAILIETINVTSGAASQVITYNHDGNNAQLARQAFQTYNYAVVLVTDNGLESRCTSNSPSITTTDLLPPALIELVTPVDGVNCVRGSQLFSASTADDLGGSGIQSVTFTLSDATGVVFLDTYDRDVTTGGAIGTASVTVDTTLIADGTYIYSATAVDYAGNALETGSGDPGAGPDFTISINNTPTSVAFISPASGTPVHGSFILSGTAESASTITAVTIVYSTSGVDAAVIATGTEAWIASIPVDASFADSDILTVTVEVHDVCGLITNSATREFCADMLCAVDKISIDPVSGVFGPSGLHLIADVADDDYSDPCNAGLREVILSVGSGFSYSTGPVTSAYMGIIGIDITDDFGLLDGESAELVLSATDGAIDEPNTCDLEIFNVTADYTAPACLIATPLNGACAGSFVISGTAEDFGAAGLAAVVISVSGPNDYTYPMGTTGTFSQTFAPGIDGTYDIVVNVTDAVGNTSSCGPVRVTIDVAAPLIAITDPWPVANVGVNGSFIISGTADDQGCSGVQDMTLEYTTSTGTATTTVSFSPVGGMNTTWSAVIPVDPALLDDAPFAVTVYAVDGIPMQGSTSATYFVDDTDSCPTLITPLVGSTVFLGPNGVVVDYTAADDDTLLLDAGVAFVYAGVSSPSVSPATATLFSSAPPALGTTSTSNTLMAGSGPGAADEFFFGLADGDIADISVCLVDGAIDLANTCCVQFQVNVDLTPPTCDIISPLDGACLDYSNLVLGATEVLVEATDDNSGLSEVGITVRSGSASVFSDSTPASGLFAASSVTVPFGTFVPGIYTVVSTVTDVAGNVVECSTITVNVNTVPAFATIDEPLEAIVNGNFDLAGTAREPIYASGNSLPVTSATPGQVIGYPLVDDDYVNVPIGFNFPFYGKVYSQMLISSNGSITFENGDQSFNQTLYRFQNGNPRIALFWDDLNVESPGASVSVESQADRVLVRFIYVPHFSGPAGTVLNATATLYNTGAVALDYGTVTPSPLWNPLIGVSPGACGTGPAVAVDLVSGTPHTMSNVGLYEAFISGATLDFVNSTVLFLPQNDMTGSTPAVDAELWYPGPGGGILAPLDASTEQSVAPVVIFNATQHSSSSVAHICFGGGFEFPFYGGTYDSVLVSARGVLGFRNHRLADAFLASVTNPATFDVNVLIPKVMPLWTNLDASGDRGGSVTYRQYDDRFIIDFEDIPEAISTGLGANDFSVILYNTGAVQFIYGPDLDIATTGSSRIAVGVSAGVYAQAIHGYDDVDLYSRGIFRNGINLGIASGAPALAAVNDNALFEIFAAGAFNLGVDGSTTTYGIQGTAVSTPLTLDANGNWNYNLTLPATPFFGNGDPLAVSVRPVGGCEGTTLGDGTNAYFTIDETVPAATVTNVSIAPYTCMNGDFQVVGLLNDSGTSGYRIDSGINDATFEFYQNGLLVTSVPVGALDTIPSIPTHPNVGEITATITVNPATLGIAPGLFGIDLVATDNAINVPNTGSDSGGTPAEVFIYDPEEPQSQMVSTRLFIAAATTVPTLQTTIYELDPDTGAELASIVLPAASSSALGSALGYNGTTLFYAPTLNPPATSIIYAITAITGPSAVTGPSAKVAAVIVSPTSTHITGIGADKDRVYVNGPLGANYVNVYSATSLAYLGRQNIGTLASGTEGDTTDIGSGIFDRTFVARQITSGLTLTSQFYESFPDSVAPGGVVHLFDETTDEAIGLGFSGTRLFMVSRGSNVVREMVTTNDHRTYNSNSPYLGTPITIPDGHVAQTVAAGPRIGSVTSCGQSGPFVLMSAATDGSPCGIAQVDFYGYESILGITSTIQFGSADTIPTLVNRQTTVFDDSAAAVASATLTAATAQSMLTDGEGQLTLYTIATDTAGNVESITAALANAVTTTIDAREPRITYLASLPFATTSDANVTVELTLRIEEHGSGLDPLDPPTLGAQFSALTGIADVTLPLTLAPPVLGVITATASFNPSTYSFPLNEGAYIDFIAKATDNCGNATRVVLADRYIVDNQAPIADDPNIFYPAESIIQFGTACTSCPWSMVDPLTWTANELLNPLDWDIGFITHTTNPGLNAQRPDYLAGTVTYPVMPQVLAQDCRGATPEAHLMSSPSGIASIELYYATGTSDATPPILAFSNLVQTITETVPVLGGGFDPLSLTSAALSATDTFVWDTSGLKPTGNGSDDYYYLKTITHDHAGNTLDPVFGPFTVLDVLSPTRTIITAEALFGTRDVRIDWEYVPYDNVGVVGYEIYRTRDAVDDVLEADPLTDFDLLDTIVAYDPDGQAITEYLDETVPAEGSYAYYIAAFDAAGNGQTGGHGLAAVISNIVVADPNDLIDPYPVTDLKVRAGEPNNGNLVAWSVPSIPAGGGAVRPLGDNVAITGWEIYRHDLGELLEQSDVSDADGDVITSPVDQNVHLIDRIDNVLVLDNVTPTSKVRLNPTLIQAERVTINAASPDQIYLFMEPIDPSRITRVWNQTTGETYKVLGNTGRVVQIDGNILPAASDVVLADYQTNARTYVDTNVIPGKPYAYAVVARDAAGNRSLISTSVTISDAVAVAFDTTAPEAIETLVAETVGCDTIDLRWDEAPYDQVGIIGYDAYRHVGDWPVTVVSTTDETQISQVVYPVINLAPSSAALVNASATITLETSDAVEDLMLVIDTTCNDLIPQASAATVDLVNDCYYILTGDQLVVYNIEKTNGFWHNLKVIYFNDSVDLLTSTGYDAQLNILDQAAFDGALYTYAVQAVDPWGNVAVLSNQATDRANDCVAPLTPLADIQANCSYANDVVEVSVFDDDISVVCAYDNENLIGPAIACVDDPDEDGSYGIPIGDNQFGQVWVSAIDTSGNTSPSVMIVNDVTPTAKLAMSNVTLIQNAPGIDDLLAVSTTEPEAVYANVYRDDSLMNLVDRELFVDDGLGNKTCTLNLGDNVSQTFYVTISDAACNESDDLEISNDTTPPAAATNVVVSNNVSGTSCDRVPVDDTLTACVASDVVMLTVYADSSLMTVVTSASVSAGPAGSCVGPISIGNNNSVDPSSLSGVYVVATDNAGNKSSAVYAAIDITAPQISDLDVFEQFPQAAGTFPRVEDELDVQIDIDTAEENEVLCVKVFTESPTLNRVSPEFWITTNVVPQDVAPAANNDVFAVSFFGADDTADDLLAAIHPNMLTTILDASFLEPTALAVKAQGTGNIWVASINPSATSEIRLSEVLQTGGRIQDVDLAIPGPVTGMTFGSGDILYFVTENGGTIYTFDTVTLTQGVLTITSGTVGAASAIEFDGVSKLFFLDVDYSIFPGGRIQAIDVTGGVIETRLTGLVEPAGIALDRLGGIHYGESAALYADIFINPQGRVSELRPGADGPLTLFEGGENEPDGDTLVGPVITADGRMITVTQQYGVIAIYQSNRRSVSLPDLKAGLSVSPIAQIIAEQVPGPDYRVEGIGLGDNAAHEIQAVVVDKAGNTSAVATVLNDVVGPRIYWADVIERSPGYEDYLEGQTEPFCTVRAYIDPYLNNEIDREDNAIYSDRTGAFEYGAVGDNESFIFFVAAEDQAGNVGQSTIAINDIFEPDAPNLDLIEIDSACTGVEDTIYGWEGSVEPDSWVEVYADYELTQYVGGTVADASGAFGPISIGDNEVTYVMVLCVDDAGNTSTAVMLDGENGHDINDLQAPYAIDLSNVDLDESETGEDFITGLTGAVIPGDASLVRIYTDENLTTELAGLSPITVSSATGGWSTSSIGTNMVVNNTYYGYASLWLVAEDDACNQALPVRIDLDRDVYEPVADRFVFNADEPNDNTIAGLEGAAGALNLLRFSTTISDASNSVLGLPLLGYAVANTAGAFDAVNVGRVASAVSHVVAMDDHGNISPIVDIDTQDDVAPAMPDVSLITLVQRGRSFNDTISGFRGAVGNGEEKLKLHAYSDASLTSELSGFPISIPQTGHNGSPAPGSFAETSLGQNYYYAGTTAGNSEVYLTAEDEFGNESEAARIALDIQLDDPDTTKIYVYAENPQTDAFISALNHAVETGARVQVSADENNILLYANFYTNTEGGWDAVNIGSLLRQPDVISGSYNFPNRRDTVFVRAIDAAGNRSNVVRVNVEIVTYAVLDAFGDITLRNGVDGVADSLQASFLADGVARDIEPGFYRANGALDNGFTVGDTALPEYTNSPTGFYRMTGLGQIEALGDVLPVDQTGFTNYATDVAKDIEVAPTQAGTSAGIYLLDGYGKITVFGGATSLTGVTFGYDIARAFKLDYEVDGSVKGAYILDGRGGLNPVGGSTLITPANTFVADQDIYIDVELARVPADFSIDGSLVLSKYGAVTVGGPMALDTIRVKSITKGLPNFGFNIARDLALSLDPETRVIQGTYVLDGFGGVHAGGAAPKIHDAPYFGFDVARDLEVLTSTPQE